MQIIKKGDKYNKLTAIKFSYRNKDSRQFWLFKCDCGNEKILNISNVKCNCVKSCGCLKTTHKMTKTKIYICWESMKQRCLNKNHKEYKNYGGRGIKICKEWLKFENFYRDMGERPVGKTLDRIKNNLGYYRSNCKWSTPKQQANNRRTNHLITFNGKTQNIKQWSAELNISANVLFYRINRGWSIKRTFSN